ncbi:hypothetical protein [Streptomyces pactum]|uniref:Uncharacterized protein n=1 Tax=Streptomyces pactum TaxID=68249 RepID=A0A1S6JGH0_9ACTN|nr:hypothetical protein [Streptomyces pactum]AQS70865.1 hypothetical protein B1H29_31795 [Streptomyces pactum]
MKLKHKINHGWQRPPEPISEAYQRQVDRSTEKAETRHRQAQKAVERAQRAAQRADKQAARKPTARTLAARDEAQRLVAQRLEELRKIEALMHAPQRAQPEAVHRTGRQERLEVGEYQKPRRRKTPKSPVTTRRNP